MTEQINWYNPYGFIATEGADTIPEPLKGYELHVKGVINKVYYYYEKTRAHKETWVTGFYGECEFLDAGVWKGITWELRPVVNSMIKMRSDSFPLPKPMEEHFLLLWNPATDLFPVSAFESNGKWWAYSFAEENITELPPTNHSQYWSIIKFIEQ